MKNKEYVRLTTSLLKKYMPVFKTHLQIVKVYKIVPQNISYLTTLNSFKIQQNFFLFFSSSDNNSYHDYNHSYNDDYYFDHIDVNYNFRYLTTD